jgi:spore coat protein SA
MKIAFVAQPWDEVTPGIGGYSSISIVSYQLALRLARAGHEVIIYAKQSHHQPKVEYDDKGILYRRVSTKSEETLLKPFRFLDRLGVFRAFGRPFFASGLYYPGFALQIARDLKQQRPDIIHIHNFSQYVPLMEAFNPDAKIILHMHCEWLSQLDRSIIARRLEQSDLVLGCSNYITHKVRLRFPWFAQHCKTAYNGVDLDDFSDLGKSDRNDGETILFVGRVSPEKGVHVLLDAFHEVSVRHPQAQLNIVGPIGTVPYDFVVAVSNDDHVSKLASFYSGKFRKPICVSSFLQMSGNGSPLRDRSRTRV